MPNGTLSCAERQFRALADAAGILLRHLLVVVPKPERSAIDECAEQQPHGTVVGPRPEERRDDDRAEDEHPAHRRSAGFLAVQFVKPVHLVLGADGLSELQ